MQQAILARTGRTIGNILTTRKYNNTVTLVLIVLAPVLIFATFWVLGDVGGEGNPLALRAVLMIDLIYAMLIAAMIASQIVRIVSARKSRSAGSRLHMRLTQVFTIMALVPTVVIAIFATVTLNFGLEGWFSDRVRNVVGNSLAAAEAYEREHVVNLQSDARLLSGLLNEAVRTREIGATEFRSILEAGQVRIQRGLTEAYVIDGNREIQARGERSYLFGYDPPSASDIARARRGEIVVIEDWGNDEFRALAPITALGNSFLYVSRDVDGEILSLLDQTKETIALYQQLENDRGRLLFEFALVYLGVAIIVILASIWGALWFADRLSRPVGRLAGAAARVGAGDFDVQVREEEGDDEISMLGRAFNRMTRQVKAQRDALMDVNIETERRRRLFDSVLSGVTAGVVGLDAQGRVEVANTAAERLLGLNAATATGQNIQTVAPEFAAIFTDLVASGDLDKTAGVDLVRKGEAERLLVKIASRSDDDVVEGYVVTFDDITELVSAQRMAAWGDVARRIAHEIKNPLTPIALSADRLKRKFGPRVGEDRAALEQYSDVIIRQTEDLRRIVDEFSKFARMPAADLRQRDIVPVLQDAIYLAKAGHETITFVPTLPETGITLRFDETMISQAMNNLLKNASEAVVSKAEKNSDIAPEIRVNASLVDGKFVISIQDNGIGFPDQRANLFEPYVTHREKGTGLGLSIVKKIVEEHAGTLELIDAPVFVGAEHHGAEVRITLPKASALPNVSADDTVKQAV